MTVNAKISELNKVVIPVLAADVDTSDVTGAVFYDASLFKKAYARATTATNLTVGKKLTLTPMQATSAAGEGAKILGTAVIFTATGSEKGTIDTDIDLEAMDEANGFTFVGLKVGTDLGSAVVAAAALILGTPRYTPIA